MQHWFTFLLSVSVLFVPHMNNKVELCFGSSEVLTKLPELRAAESTEAKHPALLRLLLLDLLSLLSSLSDMSDSLQQGGSNVRTLSGSGTSVSVKAAQALYDFTRQEMNVSIFSIYYYGKI